MTSPRVYIDSCAVCNKQVEDNEVVFFVGKATARQERGWRSQHGEHRALQMDRRGHSSYEPVVYHEGCFNEVVIAHKVAVSRGRADCD